MLQKLFRGLLGLTLVAGVSTLLITGAPLAVEATTTSNIKDGVGGVGGNDPGNQGSQVTVVIKNVINILLFLIGMIAVIMIVIAGLRFVTANGDSNTISSARNTVLYAVVGIIVAVAAYAIVNFILDQFT